MQVDGGLRPVREEDILAVRYRAGRAVQAVFEEMGLPPICDKEVEAAVVAHDSSDMPDRNVAADLEAAERLLADSRGGADIIRALARRGFRDIAEKILAIQKLRVTGDFLQTSAMVLPGPRLLSAINDANDYRGPGTGYHVEGHRKREIDDLPQAVAPRTIGTGDRDSIEPQVRETGLALLGTDPAEIVIAVGPAFGAELRTTILGLPHGAVLEALMAGVQEEGLRPRIVKIHASSDCGSIGHTGACLSGSGIAVGIQSKGTTVIHRRDLAPLNNLELFPQAPNLTLQSYRAIGRNAARYAKRAPVQPVPVQIDNMARLKHIVTTTILHLRETEQIVADMPPGQVELIHAT